MMISARELTCASGAASVRLRALAGVQALHWLVCVSGVLLVCVCVCVCVIVLYRICMQSLYRLDFLFVVDQAHLLAVCSLQLAL